MSRHGARGECSVAALGARFKRQASPASRIRLADQNLRPRNWPAVSGGAARIVNKNGVWLSAIVMTMPAARRAFSSGGSSRWRRIMAWRRVPVVSPCASTSVAYGVCRESFYRRLAGTLALARSRAVAIKIRHHVVCRPIGNVVLAW